MTKRWLILALVVGLPACKIIIPEPNPTPPPTPPPVNCLTHPTCPDGQHCEQGVGCVPDPLPDPKPPECKPGEVPVIVDGEVVRCDPAPPVPASACPKPLAPGANLFMNAKAHGNGIDSTLRIEGDPELCMIVHGVQTNNCHLESWPQRAACEMELAKGCPIWQYTMDPSPRASARGPCRQAQHPDMSCDHYGDPTFRDDPLTPTRGTTLETLVGFEGQPLACGLQRDAAGDPMAGYFVIAHGLGFARACLPDGTGCSKWVPGKDRR